MENLGFANKFTSGLVNQLKNVPGFKQTVCSGGNGSGRIAFHIHGFTNHAVAALTDVSGFRVQSSGRRYL